MTTHTIYCFSRNGAGIKSHDRIEDARAQALQFGLGDTAVGQDCVHPEKPNTATYTVETLIWNGDCYKRTDVETITVVRDRAAARAALGMVAS